MADSLRYAAIKYFSIAVLPVSFLVCLVIFFYSNPKVYPQKGPGGGGTPLPGDAGEWQSATWHGQSVVSGSGWRRNV